MIISGIKWVLSRTWGKAVRIFETAKFGLGKAGEGLSSGWKWVKKDYARSPMKYKIGGAVAVTGVSAYVLYKMTSAADKSSERRLRRYGTDDQDHSDRIRRQQAAGALREAASRIVYMNGANDEAVKTAIQDLVIQYNVLCHSLPPGLDDFAITAQRAIGATMNCALEPEVKTTSDGLTIALTNMKDDDRLLVDVHHDLQNMLHLDSKGIPLQPL